MRFVIHLEFLDTFSKNSQISNFTKMSPVGTELFHTNRQPDRHDESNSYISQFRESTKKKFTDITSVKRLSC